MNIRLAAFLILLAACNSPAGKETTPLNDLEIEDTLFDDSASDLPIDSILAIAEAPDPDLRDTSALELTILEQGLVNIEVISADIQTDIKYSTLDNFMSEDLYGDYASCYLQPVVAEMLSTAQEYVHENHPDVDLLVFDCVRPRSVQFKMWELVKGTDKQNYVAPPTSGSMHNYGAAIDLGLIHRDTGLVDMGTEYDFFGRLAQPRYEVEYVKSGDLTQTQLDNRRVLRAAMLRADFHGILSEWWHFNAFSNKEVRKRYQAVE